MNTHLVFKSSSLFYLQAYQLIQHNLMKQVGFFVVYTNLF